MMYDLSLEELVWARMIEIRKEVGPRRERVEKRASGKDRSRRTDRI